jgi:hypothetical protein
VARINKIITAALDPSCTPAAEFLSSYFQLWRGYKESVRQVSRGLLEYGLRAPSELLDEAYEIAYRSMEQKQAVFDFFEPKQAKGNSHE